jgi:hypothetical protein
VVKLQGLAGDVGLERVQVERQRGQLVSHGWGMSGKGGRWVGWNVTPSAEGRGHTS